MTNEELAEKLRQMAGEHPSLEVDAVLREAAIRLEAIDKVKWDATGNPLADVQAMAERMLNGDMQVRGQ